MNYFRYPFLFPFPFDFCCFRAVTARPITTFFKSALQFFYINDALIIVIRNTYDSFWDRINPIAGPAAV
jgi:hypothetical protein